MNGEWALFLFTLLSQCAVGIILTMSIVNTLSRSERPLAKVLHYAIPVAVLESSGSCIAEPSR